MTTFINSNIFHKNTMKILVTLGIVLLLLVSGCQTDNNNDDEIPQPPSLPNDIEDVRQQNEPSAVPMPPPLPED
jgi:hypothetical protein